RKALRRGDRRVGRRHDLPDRQGERRGVARPDPQLRALRHGDAAVHGPRGPASGRGRRPRPPLRDGRRRLRDGRVALVGRAGGASSTAPFGVDRIDPISQTVATLAGLPTGDVAPLAPNQLTSLEFYGAVPPPYYGPQDLADVAGAPRGAPRYARVVAKFAREV